jgi:hypothetical protein
MTYIDHTQQPPPSTRGGRPPVDVPPALLAQLQHSEATGARCVIDITEEHPVSDADIKELRRAVVRARYKHFAGRGKTVNIRVEPHQISYWVGPKPAKKTGGKK